MNAPPGGGRTRLWKRVAWVLAVSALLAAVTSIYLFLRPEPRRLADPEEFSLAPGERFSLDGLPMGGRYRLRACTSAAALEVNVWSWRSGATRLEANPTDSPALDLRVDGRAGGTLAIEAQSATGRMILFRERVEVTCRGDAPLDLAYRRQQLANGLPPFKCDDERLALHDRAALTALRTELEAIGRGASSGAGIVTSSGAGIATSSGAGSATSSGAAGLSDEQRACLDRITQRLNLSGQADTSASSVEPSPGAQPPLTLPAVAPPDASSSPSPAPDP